MVTLMRKFWLRWTAQSKLRDLSLTGKRETPPTPPFDPPRWIDVAVTIVTLLGIFAFFLLLTGCNEDSRCPQGTGYTWKCDAQGNCGCHSNPGGA